MRKLLRVLLLASFTLLACWGAAELVLRLTVSPELDEFRSRTALARPAALALLAKGGEDAGTQTYTYHPYYGYVFSRSLNGVSNLYDIDGNGFRGLADYRSRPEGTKLVGVFGGSAAMGWDLSDEDTLAGQLQKLLNERLPGRYMVKNFGIGAWHLPQHLFVFIRELDNLDFAIFFDGSNELFLGTQQAMSGDYPLDYPEYDARHFMRFALEPEISASFLRLARARAAFPSGSALTRSRVFLFFSRLRLERLERENRQMVKDAAALKEKELPERRTDKAGYKQAVEMALASYKKYSLVADAVAEGAGVPLLHVLQPMQTAEFTPAHMARELDLTEEEFLGKYPRTYFEYPRLVSLYHELWGSGNDTLGPKALDLATALPRDLACERYWQDVVHPRKEGMAMIAEKVFAKTLDAGWFPRAAELARLELKDSTNAGRVLASLDAAGLLPAGAEAGECEWQLGGRDAGRGRTAALDLPVGESILFLHPTGAGTDAWYRQPVLVRDNLAVLDNLALGARASSNDPSSAPALAVDGRTTGTSLAEVWWSTSQSKGLWWQADLGAPQSFKAVEIFFREDFRDPGQVSNLVLLGANREDFADAVVLGRRGREPFPEDRRWVSYVQGGPCRYLRVAREDDEYLVLAEVRVLADRQRGGVR
jgi:hypothetical protein